MAKIKYRVRYFYTKGAFLVLVWTLLLSVVSCSLASTIELVLHALSLHLSSWWIGILLLIVTTAAILSGILADIKFRKYKVTKAGVVLLFISTVLNCSTVLIIEIDPSLQNHIFLVITSICFVIFMAITGLALSIVSLLQLGLDQMPDASTSSVTSFITWFSFCLFCGYWVNDLLYQIERSCLDEPYTLDFILLWNFFLAVCVGIILISDFLTANKWLIMEPQSSNVLRTIYQVLKFAAKHKAPLNRSAFTYWEENIPSRIDLGKSKYGGPFSTEQVEDVKTVLRLLVLSISLWFVTFGVTLELPLSKTPSSIVGSCSDSLLVIFTYNTNWCILLTTLVQEFIVYPLLRGQLTTILKRIGIAALISTISTLICLILEIVNKYLLETCEIRLEWVMTILYFITSAVSQQIIFTSVIELTYAQSPYIIRGVSTGYIILLLVTSGLLGKGIQGVLHTLFIALSVKTSVCLMGFIIHCVLANWYKRRVRDEVYASHRVIEEVYDRYLSYSN